MDKYILLIRYFVSYETRDERLVKRIFSKRFSVPFIPSDIDKFGSITFDHLTIQNDNITGIHYNQTDNECEFYINLVGGKFTHIPVVTKLIEDFILNKWIEE